MERPQRPPLEEMLEGWSKILEENDRVIDRVLGFIATDNSLPMGYIRPELSYPLPPRELDERGRPV